jgi:hypothetical protein
MDKNIINIDDLFRQRLSGGEEEEKDGAWLKMSKLLDKEMPVRPVGGVRWRRMFTYTAGLLLLAVAGAGGYEIVAGHRDISGNSGIASTGIDRANNTRHSRITTTTERLTSNTPVTTNADEKSKAALIAVSNVPQANYVYAKTISSKKSIINNSVSSITLNKFTAATSGNSIKKPAKRHKPNTILSASATHNSNKQLAKQEESLDISSTRVAQNDIIAAASTITDPAHNIKNHRHVNAKMAVLKPAGTLSIDVNKSMQNVNQKAVILEKQKIGAIEVVQHNVTKPGDRSGHYRNDTIDKGEVSIDKYMQSATAPATANSEIKTVVSKSAVTNGTSLAVVQPTSIFVTSNGKSKNILLASAAKESLTSSNASGSVLNHTSKRSNTLSNFAEMILDFRTNLGNAKFAPGITGGINATFFAPNNMSGFQLGITGNFLFNQNWSFMAELKYFNRFPGNSVINDNYVTYSTLPSGGFSKDSAQHFFKYNNLQSIELPFALQYSIGKLGIYGGGNIAYNFSINNDFSTNYLGEVFVNSLGKSITPKYTEDDFSSRFAIGYIAGANYFITPQLKGDVRLVQTVWDNSSTIGSQQLSSDLYKHPSLQLSIGYIFKKKESRIP